MASAYRTKVEETAGILDYWPLSKNSGTAAKGGVNATLTNTSSVAEGSGPLEKGDEGATGFNGTTGVGQTGEIALEKEKVTVEFWLYWTLNGTNDDFAMEFGTTANSATGFNFDWNNSTSGESALVSLKTNYGGASHDRRYTFTKPTQATWHHVVAVFKAATKPVVYVDGAAVTVTEKEVTNTQTGNFGKAKLNLMCRNGASLQGEGRMAHVALFEGELSKATVEAHYAARKEEAGGTPAEIPLNASAGVASASLALSAPTAIALGASAGVASAALALAAPTKVPLGTSAGVASASVALSAPTAIPLSASAGVASPTLALAARTMIPLGASAGVAATSLALTAPTTIPIGASAGVGSMSLALTAPSGVPLASSQGVGSTSLAVSAPTRVLLGASAGIAAPTLALRAPTTIALGTSVGVSSASLELTTPIPAAVIPLGPSAGVGSATLALTAPTKVTLGASAGAATVSFTLSAPTRVALGSSAGIGSGSLALIVPTRIPLSPSTGTSSASIVLTTGHKEHVFPTILRPSGLDLWSPVAAVRFGVPEAMLTVISTGASLVIDDPASSAELADGGAEVSLSDPEGDIEMNDPTGALSLNG